MENETLGAANNEVILLDFQFATRAKSCFGPAEGLNFWQALHRDIQCPMWRYADRVAIGKNTHASFESFTVDTYLGIGCREQNPASRLCVDGVGV